MAHDFTRGAEPYPDDDSGVAMRMMRMPVSRPGPAEAARPRAERRSGGDCDLLATLGRRPASPVSPDERVHDWSEDLVRSTARPVR